MRLWRAKRIAPHLRDPSWYRILYARGAQGLHTENGAHGDMKLRKQLEEAIGELGLPPLVSADPCLDQAQRDLQTLLQATTTVLRDAAWRWPRRRPPFWARWKAWVKRPRWRPGTRRVLLDDFLDRTVEPAAVIALLSIHAELGRKVEIPRCDVKRVDRREQIKTIEWPRTGSPGRDWGDVPWPSIEWLVNYVADMEVNEPRPRTIPIRIGSLFWFRKCQLRHVSYRVDYSRACLHARLARPARKGRQARPARARGARGALDLPALDPVKLDPGQLERAGEALDEAFRRAPGPQERERLARWAWHDPGLAPLRTDRTRFERIVGRKRTVKPKDSKWRRLWGRVK